MVGDYYISLRGIGREGIGFVETKMFEYIKFFGCSV